MVFKNVVFVLGNLLQNGSNFCLMILFVSKFVASECCCECQLFQEKGFLLPPLTDYNDFHDTGDNLTLKIIRWIVLMIPIINYYWWNMYNDYNMILLNNNDNNDYFYDFDKNDCNVILRKETITMNNKFMAKLIKKHFMRRVPPTPWNFPSRIIFLGSFFLGSFFLESFVISLLRIKISI